MKLLLVFLVFFLCSYYSNAQMQEEGTTTTSVIEDQGDVQEITETAVTIENKTTGDILDGDTGIVSSRYEGDMDLDWGGIGSANMPNCPSQFSGGGRCAKGTSNSLTTFQQNINIAQFHIEDGGALEWSLDGWHSQANTSMYFELKGYNDNILLWTDKTDFAYNNYTDSSSYNYAGNYDYAGGLDKLFVSVGGAKNYYFDNVQLDVNYNVISTVITTYLQYVESQVMINQTIVETEIYEYQDTIAPETSYEEMDNYAVGMPDVLMDQPMAIEPLVLEQTMEYEPIVETNTFEPEIVTMETVIEDIQEVMEVQEPTNAPTEPVEEVKDSKPTPETASNEEVVEEVKEEPKEVVEEIEVVEEKPKEEEVKEAKVEDKPTKKQEAKQEKAKEIMAGFESQYDAVAQLTTLALVNALGADIKTYSQIEIQVQPIWYESKDIYAETMLQDPLGNYFGVRDSLVFEQMIGSQYE